MKKGILLPLFIFLIVLSFKNKVHSQNKFQIDYYSNFSTMDMDIFTGVKKTSTGYAMAGMVDGISLPIIQSMLVNTDTSGTVLWAKKIKDGGFLSFKNLYVNDLQTTSAGGYIMTGSFNDNSAMLLNVNSAGASVFSYSYGKSPHEFGNTVKQTSDGGFVVAGTTMGKSMNTDKDSTSIYIFKANSSGVYQWGRSYSLTGSPVFDSQDAVNDVVEVPTGYVFAGYNSQNNSGDTTTNILVFKTDVNGTIQWMKTYGSLSSNESANSIKLLSNGDLLVGGYSDQPAGGFESIAVLELDGSGNLVSSRAYGLGIADELGSIQQTSNGGFAIVGWTIGLTWQSFLMTLNSSYTPVFAKKYNSFIGGLFTKGEQVPGGYVLGSMIGTTGYQLHMIKTDANGVSGCNETSVTPVQYTWTPSVTSVTPTVYTGGSGNTFTVSLTSVTPTTTIDCIVLPLSVSAGNDLTICSGASTTIGGAPTANHGTPGYTYSWTSSPSGFTSTAANPSVAPTVTTTYTVSVTDGAGGIATDVMTVNVNPLPTVYALTGGGSYCAGGSGVTIGLGGSQSGVTYQLQVGGVNTGSAVSGTGSSISFGNQTTAGNYTVVATITATGCTRILTGVTVTINPLPTAYSLTGGGDYCTGGSGVTVGLSNSQSGVNYQLQVGGVNSGSVVAGTGNAISFGTNTAAGTYTVIATNPTTGCVNSMTGNVAITIDPLPTAFNLTGGGSYCIGGSGVAVGLSGSQTGVSYQLLANGTDAGTAVAGTGNAISFGNQTIAGTYTVTAISTPANCTGTMTGNVTININSLPNPNLPASVGTCVGHSVTLTASGGGNYAWSPSPDLSATDIANPIASPVDTTTYMVTVTDGNGCSNTGSVTVNVYNAPPANAGIDTSLCNGASIQLLATGGISYAWSPGLGLSATNVPNPSAYPVSTTTYHVTVTDGAGCSASDDIVVTVNQLPFANAGTGTTICPGDSTTLNATGGVLFAWSPSFGLNATNIYNPIAHPAATTTYIVTVTDIHGCSNTDDVTITVNTPTANAGSPVSICRGSSTVLGASGGSTYFWSPSTGLNNVSIAAPTANPTTTTTYTVLVTNGAGCTATSSVTVTVNPVPVVEAGPNVSICKGSSTNLAATGGTTYTWGPSVGLSNTNINNPVASPVNTTTYTVTATNSFGCTATDNLTVDVLATPVANAGADQAICLGGSASLSATGGGSYLWNTGDTTALESYSPSFTTTYVVTVSYTDGCSSTDGVMVTVNSIPVVTVASDPAGLAYVGQTITFTASVTPPDNNVTYNFYVNNTLVQSGSENVYQTNTLTNSQTVSVTVTENGCSNSASVVGFEIIQIPNAFIPDGDNVLNKRFVPGLKLTIINRWGQKLYEGNDGWDGKYNGNLVSPGTYYYIISIDDLQSGVTELKGSVTLVQKQ